MTYPSDLSFKDESLDTGTVMDLDKGPKPVDPAVKVLAEDDKFPSPIIKGLKEEQIDGFTTWMDQWLDDLINDQSQKQNDWDEQERAYRAKSDPPKTLPYVGACTDVVPAIAMAVDPIHARLDTGIFKQDPVIRVKVLRKSYAKYGPALEKWINFYFDNILHFRQIASPRILECTKLGTAVFKTVYDRQRAKIKTYDTNTWQVIDKVETRFAGPRPMGVALGDFLFPASYQFLHDCPVVAERQRTTFSKLKVAEASGKLANVDQLKSQESNARTKVESAREEMSNHTSSRRYQDELEVYEVWCDYDIDDDGLPEHLVCTFHRETKTVLQLRYNWYFHQRKPYTVIPYTITNDSLYGIGIAEMVLPFQQSLTRWEQMAKDNAYLANIRMYIARKDCGIEEVPRLYGGRVFFVDSPKEDFIPFAGGDVYPSTLTERQNTFGLVEKRTGVSDYLTGRESPIIGSRATATSTVALIQEGTKRVEEVLENWRFGISEIVENTLAIWMQFGVDGLDDIVFGDDDTAVLLKEFFSKMTPENINGAIAIDLSAVDAAGSRQAMQQMQLQIIQIMMQYLEKVLMAGKGAIEAQMMGGPPQLIDMIKDVMTAARNMFRDLMTKYDVPNPDEYLPDLEKYLNGVQPNPGELNAGIAQGLLAGAGGAPGLPAPTPTTGQPNVPRPAVPGGSNGGPRGLPFAGQTSGV